MVLFAVHSFLRVVLAVGDFNCCSAALDSAYMMDDPVRDYSCSLPLVTMCSFLRLLLKIANPETGCAGLLWP